MKTISIEYFKAEFESLRTNVTADIALAQYMNAVQGDNIQEINFWATTLLNHQWTAIKETIDGKPLPRKRS